jgi:hypothetical protein
VQPVHTDARTATVTCGNCGKQYVLHAWGELSGTSPSLPERARRLAKEQRIDLPGAYSLLLGIMSVEELRELGDAGSRPSTSASTEEVGKHHYDRAFQKAIDEGLLTARQAAERGSREACAGRLASRHRISHEVALDVVDNRISLLDALRWRDERDGGAMHLTVPDRRVGRTVGLVALLVAVALAAVLFRGSGADLTSGPGESTRVGPAEVRSDAGGRIVEVIGPDPRSVLRAYCVQGASRGRLEPLKVVPSSLPGARTHLGLLRDLRRPEQLLAIPIREDRASSRWLAGDGSRPLLAEPAPRGAHRAIRWK